MVDTLKALYPHRCEVWVNTPDEEDADNGQPILNLEKYLEDQPCRLLPRGTQLKIGRAMIVIDTPMLFAPITVELQEDMIVQGLIHAENERSFDGAYRVTGRSDPGGEGDHWEYQLEEVR